MYVLGKIWATYTSTIWSWVCAAIAFGLSWLGDSKELLLYIVCMTVLDTLVGIARSHKAGIGIKSSGIRRLIAKLLVYFCIILMTVMLDKSACFETIIITRIVGALLMGAEAVSVIGSLAILFPSIGALRIVRMLLYSEISDKLHIDKQELEKYIEHNNETEQPK
jgi:hypothetical protein